MFCVFIHILVSLIVIMCHHITGNRDNQDALGPQAGNNFRN